MNIEEKKEWLFRYQKCKDIVISLEQLEYEKRINAITISAQTLDGMPKACRNENRSDYSIVKHLDVVSDLDLAREKEKEVEHEILTAISGLKDHKQAQVLRLRYINGYSWEQIQTFLNYSKANVFRLHKLGLNNLVIA